MKRYGHLFEQVYAEDNLYRSYQQARKGKRDRADVVHYELNLEAELTALRSSLRNQSYCPGPFRHFTLYERKPRLISVAPFRDRVLHHAVMNIVEPLLDRRMSDNTYACRTGRGVHQAIKYYQQYANCFQYLLKLDIRKFFPSIDHEVLKGIFRRRFKDQQLLWLLDTLVDHAPEEAADFPMAYFTDDDLLSPLERKRGLPIGNLSSQVFANLYLDDFDHWIKEVVRVGGYIRYMDDLFIFGNDKEGLWEAHNKISKRLGELRLQLHPGKTQLYRTTERMDVLGVIASRERRWLRNDNGHRFIRRYRRMLYSIGNGAVDRREIEPRIRSWIGHARYGETERLREKIFNDYPLHKAVVVGRENGSWPEAATA